MKTGVVVFPGTNREKDVADAFERASGERPQLIWHQEATLPPLDLVVLPGGFSFGDYLRCGAIAAHSPIMQAIKAHAARGGYVLGICNGFQMLCETKLLPGALLHNTTQTFICKSVNLRAEPTGSVFSHAFKENEVFSAPIAHGEGNYFAEPQTLERLEAEGRVAFRYVSATGEVTLESNPNGSQQNIAGILSENKRVLGLMPHLENRILPEQGGAEGLKLFMVA